MLRLKTKRSRSVAMTLKEATESLAAAGVADPLSDARRIFAELGGVSRHDLFSPAVSTDREEAVSAVARRAKREPLQYILGEAYFYRERYKVTPDCLIPREDTELLVDFAVKNLPRSALFIDLCTGSGCVAISTLAARRDTRAVGVDLFDKTLSIARENAEYNGVGKRLGLLRADVLSPSFMDDLGLFDCIISNPPYIETKEVAKLSRELSYEPNAALDGGEDGLKFYKAIVKDYAKYLTERGFMLFEIGYDQAKAIAQISLENGFSCEIFKDYGGNDRVAYLHR